MARRKPNRGGRPKKPTVSARERAARAAHQDAFLAQFVASGTVAGACRSSGVGRTTHYDWLLSDPKYADRFKHAEVESIDLCETEARRRALVGVDEPVYYKGVIVGHVRKQSDTLLMFILNGRRPEVFRQRFEHTGKDGGPIKSEHTIQDAKASLLDKLERLAARALTDTKDGK